MTKHRFAVTLAGLAAAALATMTPPLLTQVGSADVNV